MADDLNVPIAVSISDGAGELKAVIHTDVKGVPAEEAGGVSGGVGDEVKPLVQAGAVSGYASSTCGIRA